MEIKIEKALPEDAENILECYKNMRIKLREYETFSVK